MALVTAAQVRAQMPNVDSSVDALLDTLIASCGRAFARFCGYPGRSPTMEAATYTHYSGGGYVRVDGREVVLGVWPVIAVTSLHDDPADEAYGAATLVADSGYTLRGDQGERIRLTPSSSHAWSRGTYALQVVWSAGYDPIPEDLQQLAVEAVRHAYDQGERRGLKSASTGGLSVSFTDADFLPPAVQAGLAGFVLPGVLL